MAHSESIVVGIISSNATSWDPTPYRAIEGALPVRFEPRTPGDWAGLSGIIVIGSLPGHGHEPSALPRVLFDVSDGQARRRSAEIVFTRSRWLPRPFRGQRLTENLGPAPIPVQPADDVLALSGGRPIWVHRPEAGAWSYVTSVLPEGLKDGESLRDLFCERRFFSLLPLLHFVRLLLGEAGWKQPALRASFMFDDPNLHWTSYGYINFRRLARHATEGGYHVASAMVPRDMWFAHSAARRIFRENGDSLSLLVHGNNHVRRELGRLMPECEAVALAKQAIERTTAFERRTGIAVSRVMAAPHGTCSERMLSALMTAGFEAICIGGAQPWLFNGRYRVAGRWEPADVVGGFPVLPRVHFSDPRDDIVFRAFLGQPLIVYGHHTDLARGLDVLESWSAKISALGDVRWLPLDRIARTNFATRRDGTTLHVRLFTRRAHVVVPDGFDQIAIELPSPGSGPESDAVSVSGIANQPLPVPAGSVVRVPIFEPGVREIRLWRTGAACLERKRPRLEPWAFGRRALAEARDRALPLIRPARS